MKCLYLFIILVVFVGCADSDLGCEKNSTVDYVLFSSATINSTSTRADTISQGGIGVYRLAENNYTAINNVKYSHNADGWQSSTPISLGGDSASICAYYPYGSSEVTDTISPTQISLLSQEYSKQQDLCYMSVKKVNNSMLRLPLKMNRAYSQITFVITHDDTYGGKCAVTGISMANAGIKTKGSIDITKAKYADGIKSAVSYDPKIDSIAKGGKDTTSLLMVPVTEKMTDKVTFSLKIDGLNKIVSLDASSLEKLMPGVNYKVSLTIRANVILIIDAPVVVVGWQNVSVNDSPGYNGELKSYYPESNCYIVAPNDSVRIPVSRALVGLILKGGTVVSLPEKWSAELLWSDKAGPLTSTGTVAGIRADKENYLIIVKTGSAQGNSVICMRDPDTKEIYWSWHIWTTSYNPDAKTYTYNGMVWMDRNIGALSATSGNSLSYGVYYQWGRKDPFPGPNGLTSTTTMTLYNTNGAITGLGAAGVPNTNGPADLLKSIQNPFIFYKSTSATGGNWNSASNIWGNPAIGSYKEKTNYDPCPVGWRIPYSVSGSPWNGLVKTGFYYGMNWAVLGYYPAAGIREKSSAAMADVGLKMRYYSATSTGTSRVLSMGMDGTDPNKFTSGDNVDTGSAFSIRCVKE